MHENAGRLANATPILRVKDLAVSLAYYTHVLGFSLDWGTESFASVSRQRCTLFLCEGGQGHAGTWLWIPADNVELLYTEWKATGATIRQAPTNFKWGSRELQVWDPDGHVLRFASDATEEPIGQFPNDRTDG